MKTECDTILFLEVAEAGIRLTRFSVFFGLVVVSMLEVVVRGLFVEATKTLLTLLLQTRIEDAGRGRYRCG